MTVSRSVTPLRIASTIEARKEASKADIFRRFDGLTPEVGVTETGSTEEDGSGNKACAVNSRGAVVLRDGGVGVVTGEEDVGENAGSRGECV